MSYHKPIKPLQIKFIMFLGGAPFHYFRFAAEESRSRVEIFLWGYFAFHSRDDFPDPLSSGHLVKTPSLLLRILDFVPRPP